MNMLFSPYSLGSLELANRIVLPPMCQYSATADGLATDWHLQHYASMALSGLGLLIVEATAVLPEGRISGNDLGIWSDETADALAAMVARVRRLADVPMAVQLAHAGRKGSRVAFIEDTLQPEAGGWRPVAPSALAYGDGFPVPDALDAAGIRGVVDAFAAAAVRAHKADFDAVEIHAAHGYLLHEFLSPETNRRDDDYGGTPEKRMRLVLEVFDAVRSAFPSGKPVGIRISGSDWLDGGWDIDDSVRLAWELKRRGCAYMHVSGGGLSLAQRLRVAPGYQVAMADRIRRETGMSVIAVGLITDALQAETILQNGSADLVAVGRGLLYDPRWPWHAAERLGASVPTYPQYVRARPYTCPKLFAPYPPGATR